MRSLRPALFALPLIALTACAADTRDQERERVSATNQAIVGGATSTTAQDAAVMIITNGQFGCTGTLIAPNLVLTARHCVAGDIDESTACGNVKNDLAASVFGIALGVNADEAKKVARGVKLYTMPSTTLCGWDIALIQLDVDVPNAKLARVRFEKLAVGETTFAVGYGSATPDGPPTGGRRQRQTTVQAVGPATKAWPAKSGESISYDVPAGDLATGESTCFGDSGGPLFDESGAVVGVTSRGIDGECVDRPSVYAAVASHAQFIQGAATSAGHPLDTLSPANASADEGDPGDDADSRGDEGSAARRTAAKPAANAGCSAAASPSSTSFGSVFGIALLAAASFRRSRQTK